MAKAKADGSTTTKKTLTDYIVLVQTTGDLAGVFDTLEDGDEPTGEKTPDRFEAVRVVAAGSEAQAKRKVFDELVKDGMARGGGELSAVLVAAPVRSWKPKRHRALLTPQIVVD